MYFFNRLKAIFYFVRRLSPRNKIVVFLGGVAVVGLGLTLMVVGLHKPAVTASYSGNLSKIKPPYWLTSLERQHKAVMQVLSHMQQTLAANEASMPSLLSKMDHLQETLKALQDKTNSAPLEEAMQQNTVALQSLQQQGLQLQEQLQQQKKEAIQVMDSAQVEKYFTLIAVQDFSDGLRAVLNVLGQPMVLALHETCTACQGWQLIDLDFSAQKAVFQKDRQRVILQAH